MRFIKKVNPQQDDKRDPDFPFSSSATDLEGWRLKVEDGYGRLKWNYCSSEEQRSAQPQDSASKYYLGLPMVRSLRSSIQVPKDLADLNESRHRLAPRTIRPVMPFATVPYSTASSRSRS